MKKKIAYKSNVVIIAKNKRARYEYCIKQELEAGVVLQGWEVKSLRYGKVNISDSYVLFKSGEAYLLGATFQPLTLVSSHVVCEPMRARKLLLNKDELDFLVGRVNREGYTIIALSIHWKKIWVKINIGVAKGKKKYNKCNDIKKREWQVDKARIMKYTSC